MTSYSYCRNYGKDKVIFVTKEDHANPSTVELPPPPPTQGLITKEGEINWSCPCLGGMATGPCGVQFRDAFSCFHYSEADPKGSDCYDSFRKMQECFSMYPTVYNKTGGGDDDEETSLDIPAMDDIKENVIQEDVTQKNVIQEDVTQENVIQEDVTQENVIQEDDKEYKAITAEIPSQVIEKKSSDT